MRYSGSSFNKNANKKPIIIVAMLSIVAVMLLTIIVIPIINVNPSSTSITTIGNTNSANDKEKHIVPVDQIVSGGPPPDGIPSIDDPKFISVQEAGRFLEDSDFVLGLNINGDIRAYPLQILVWHEIVNDNVGGIPVAVT